MGLVVEVACGPFCCEDFIGWDQSKPIHSFLKQAKESKPDALILCGPFVDEENKVLHTCERTYLDEFIHFLQSLRKHLEDNIMADTTIIFVPSISRIFKMYASFYIHEFIRVKHCFLLQKSSKLSFKRM